MFAVASVTGLVQLYQGSGREYSLANEIKEIQVRVYTRTCHVAIYICIHAYFILCFYLRQLVSVGALMGLS